jgi:hypothetical protein
MSRWHLTSSENADREARSVCQRANLRSSGQISDANCHGQAYLKRVVATANLLKCGENDWICSAGTIIYNERLGEDALRECYTDFVTAGISAVQSKAIGHYALAIKRNNEVVIFTDPQGALNLYYICTGSFWFIANSLYVCASALSHRKIDATKLLVATLQSSLPGEDTFYSDIKRLFGTQMIRIDIGGGTFQVERIPKSTPALSWGLPSIQDAIDQYKQEVRAVFRELTAVGPIGLFGTGGMDSRTILAGLLDQQAAVQLMYGIGNSRLTDYDNGDLDVAQFVAKLYNLPFQQLDWSGNQPYNEETLQELFRIYGFKYEIYGAPESFLRTFNGGISPYPKLFLGGYSPAFTNAKPWERNQTSFTFDELIADCMQYQGGTVENSRSIVDKAGYRSVFATEVKTGLRCAEMAYPDNGASLETFVKARAFLYIRAESRFLNFANEFGHYIAPFLMKRLYEPLLSVPFEYRAKDEFQLRLIHALAPGLVEVPLHSGWGPARIDRDTFRLIRDRVDQKKSIVGRIAKVVLPSVLRKPARNIYSRVRLLNKQAPAKLTDRDSAIVNAYSRQVMSDPLGRRWFSSASEFTPKMLARIRHYLVGVNTLGYSR